MAYNKIVTGLVGALVVAFFLLFAFSGNQYSPYVKGSNYSKYEAMEDNNTRQDDNAAPEFLNSADEVLPETEKSYQQRGDKEPFEPILAVPRTINYSPLRDSEIIDKFSQATSNGMEGVNGCVSSGLSNSGGYICLTPELIKLLKTRGGNATGGDIVSSQK